MYRLSREVPLTISTRETKNETAVNHKLVLHVKPEMELNEENKPSCRQTISLVSIPTTKRGGQRVGEWMYTVHPATNHTIQQSKIGSVSVKPMSNEFATPSLFMTLPQAWFHESSPEIRGERRHRNLGLHAVGCTISQWRNG